MRTLPLLLLALACGGPVDADQDGYAEGDDCDDSNAAISPDAQEACNDVDDDCDGQVDEPIARGATEYWRDEDGDGFGVERWGPDADDDGEPDNSGLVVTCDPPLGFAEEAGDCDDGNANVFPGQGC